MNVITRILKSQLLSEYLLDEPFLCPQCNEVLIKYSNMKICLECSKHNELMNHYKQLEPVPNKGTEYEGIDWEQLFNSYNGNIIKDIKKMYDIGEYYLILYGKSKGVGKTTTAMVISYHERIKGKRVRIVTMSDVQNRMTAGNEDPYHVCEELKSCDLLIVDEIGRGIGESKWHRANWHDILSKRYYKKRSTILVGNISGKIRTTEKTGVYASDFLDEDRLKEYTAFEYTGNSHRGNHAN